MDIYFDNAATTRPSATALAAAAEINTGVFANPSSAHARGLEAERAVKSSATVLARLLGVSPDEIIFTSGGTEGNNMAILGAAGARPCGVAFLSSMAEHPSVTGPLARLSELGAETVMIPLDAGGLLDMDKLEHSLTPEVRLVSVMHVNNETGVMQDIAEIARLVRRRAPKALFHVDGVQGFGKHTLHLGDVDIYVFSGHKLHGIKGTGAMYVRKGVTLTPLFFGGGQQCGTRPGTENTPGIAALAAAAAESFELMDRNLEHATLLKRALLDGINAIDGVTVNGRNTSPYIANISFSGVKSETLINALSANGVFASAGAACHGKDSSKNILTHYGLPANIAGSAVRFSFSRGNTPEEAARCVEIIKEQVAFLRKFSK